MLSLLPYLLLVLLVQKFDLHKPPHSHLVKKQGKQIQGHVLSPIGNAINIKKSFHRGLHYTALKWYFKERIFNFLQVIKFAVHPFFSIEKTSNERKDSPTYQTALKIPFAVCYSPRQSVCSFPFPVLFAALCILF
jgi:hypothetical protein